MANPVDIREQLDAIERGAWSEWKGLEGAWSRSDLESIAGALHSCRGDELSGKPVQYCELSLARQPQPLQCFFSDDGQVILLRLDDPRSAESWPALSRKLGPPGQANLLPPGHVHGLSMQYIYAARGMTLYVRARTEPTESIISAVSLYAPTSARTYLNSLGGDETIEYLDDPLTLEGVP